MAANQLRDLPTTINMIARWLIDTLSPHTRLLYAAHSGALPIVLLGPTQPLIGLAIGIPSFIAAYILACYIRAAGADAALQLMETRLENRRLRQQAMRNSVNSTVDHHDPGFDHVTSE